MKMFYIFCCIVIAATLATEVSTESSPDGFSYKAGHEPQSFSRWTKPSNVHVEDISNIDDDKSLIAELGYTFTDDSEFDAGLTSALDFNAKLRYMSYEKVVRKSGLSEYYRKPTVYQNVHLHSDIHRSSDIHGCFVFSVLAIEMLALGLVAFVYMRCSKREAEMKLPVYLRNGTTWC